MNANFRYPALLIALVVAQWWPMLGVTVSVWSQDAAGTSGTSATRQRGAAGFPIAWRLDQQDFRGTLSSYQEGESRLRSHSGDSSYRFSFQSGSEEQILAITPIQPSYVIRELHPRLHVFCHQDGVQLMARVVLPRTESPSGDGPMRFWVRGDRCRHARRWTQLGFGEKDEGIYQSVREQLPILRRTYGSHVDDQHAYIDALGVNLYGGRGQQEIFLDSVQIEGQVVVPPEVMGKSGGQVLPISYQQSLEVRPSRVRIEGTAVMVDDQPVVIRAIEYNGESMATLMQLGFNTIWMDSPPTLSQLQRARDHRMWVIAPPPVEDGVVQIDHRYDAVLAWLVGDQVHWSDSPVVKQRIDLIHQVDVREGRPTLVRARTGMAEYSRAADIVCVGKPVLGTSFPLHRYSNFIQQRTQLAQAYVPLLAEIDTELPRELHQQVRAMSGVDPPLAIQPEQLRSQCFQAIAGGARGFLFRSRSRLDDNRMESLQRRLALQWVNQQIFPLRPWIASGLALGQEAQPESHVLAYAAKTSLSRLLLIQQTHGREAFTAGWSRPEMLTVYDSGAGASSQVYRLTPTGLVPADHQNLGQQLQVYIQNPGDWEVLVITQDPKVIRYVDQYSPGNDHTVLTLEQADLTAEWLGRLTRAMVQANRDRPEIRSAVDYFLGLRQSLAGLATSDDPLAYWNQLLMMERQAAEVRYQLVTEAQQVHSWPTASPLTVHPILVPLHWQSVTRFSDIPWSPNGLPGGDFEDLEHTIRSGWRHRSSGGSTVQSFATLDESAAVEGRRGLVLTAQNASGNPAIAVEHTPIWIESGTMTIPADHLVRIAGQVRIDQPIAGSIDGVTIQDSLGGEALQQRLPVTRGWLPFVIYRATQEPHDLQLTLALHGLGTVMFDEITVQMAPLPDGPGQIRPRLDLSPDAIPPSDTRPEAGPLASNPESGTGPVIDR